MRQTINYEQMQGFWCGAEQLGLIRAEESRQICYSLCSASERLFPCLLWVPFLHQMQVEDGRAKKFFCMIVAATS